MSTTEKQKPKSGPELAVDVLTEAGKPLHVRLIAERVIEADRKRPKSKRSYKGKTPEQTISAMLTLSHVRGNGPFVKVSPGVFALREWKAAQKNKAPELPEGLRRREPVAA